MRDVEAFRLRVRDAPAAVVTLRVLGAGLGRTGTNSLKLAFERLLGGRVHHMYEVSMDGARQFPLWQAAADGAPYEQWAQALDGFVGGVDWPSCRWYGLLAEENPDAIVVLSHRKDADAWWRSADRTIFQKLRTGPPHDPGLTMMRTLLRGHIGSYDDESTAKAAYERHNAGVRERIPRERLVEWQPEDGWEPLCAALGLPVPDEPFPVANTTEEYRARKGWE